MITSIISWPFAALFRRKKPHYLYPFTLSYSGYHCICDCDRHWNKNSSLLMDRDWVGAAFTLTVECGVIGVCPCSCKVTSLVIIGQWWIGVSRWFQRVWCVCHHSPYHDNYWIRLRAVTITINYTTYLHLSCSWVRGSTWWKKAVISRVVSNIIMLRDNRYNGWTPTGRFPRPATPEFTNTVALLFNRISVLFLSSCIMQNMDCTSKAAASCTLAPKIKRQSITYIERWSSQCRSIGQSGLLGNTNWASSLIHVMSFR